MAVKIPNVPFSDFVHIVGDVRVQAGTRGVNALGRVLKTPLCRFHHDWFRTRYARSIPETDVTD